jgi:hypothetical protein
LIAEEAVAPLEFEEAIGGSRLIAVFERIVMSQSDGSAAAQLETFLCKFSPLVQAQAREILRKMRARLPGACELVFDNYNALAVGFSANEKASGIVFSIAVYPRWVSLFFARGPELPDPQGLLRGTGSRVRHIVLNDVMLLDSPAVEALIAEGLARADPPIDHTRLSCLIIKFVSAKQRPRRTGK